MIYFSDSQTLSFFKISKLRIHVATINKLGPISLHVIKVMVISSIPELLVSELSRL